MRRSPLLRMAAVGGVAYMGSKAGTNRAMAQQSQAQQAQGQQPPAQTSAAPPPLAPPPPPTGGATSAASDRITQLKELAGLRDSGALTQEEFDKEKARILA